MDNKDFSRVVAFRGDQASEAKVSRIAERSLPVPVASVRDTASSWLFARMKEVFASVDDTLFAMAEKLHTQEEQDGVFQALRTLRLERTRFARRFIGTVQQGFLIIEERHSGIDGGGADSKSDGLSLVQDDTLEQQVALKSIIANAKRDNASPIAELALRLDTLLPVKIYDENMPLSPGVLGRAFLQSLAPLDIHLRARLTVLKKFEQLLALKLEALYRNCNQMLIERGVLPNLKDPLLQRRAPRSPGGTSAASRGAGGVPSQPLPAAAGTTGRMPSGTGGVAEAAPNSGSYGLLPVSVGVAPLATPDLLQHLGALQVLPLQASDGGQVLDVSGLLQQRLVAAKQGASLHELDTEVIRMVDMLFSFMLEDRNLAEPIKVQLIRLQLPLLKLAVADKSFFGKGGHPARKLFNALADAAIGWQPGEQFRNDPFYKEVCATVERVLEELDGDEKLYAQLLQDFEAYVERERRRARVMERRSVDEAQGNARVEAAKARVAAVFDALAAERELPKVVHIWLNRVWNSVLFRTCLRDGTDSDSWRRSVLTARDLVWSVVAPMPESRFKLQQLWPGLRKRLDEGAESLSLNTTERQRLLAALDSLYRERQALGERVESERERRTRERLVQELRREADSDRQIPPSPGAEPKASQGALPGKGAAEAVAASSEGEAATGNFGEGVTNLPAVEELQRVAHIAPLTRASDLAPLASSDEHWQQTYHLKGSWFMLHDGEKAPVRCRLAAIIRELDQFMFVNRAGIKVAVYTRLELAHALRSDKVTPLDRGPLFERALKYVVGTIGEVKVDVAVAVAQEEHTAAPA